MNAWSASSSVVLVDGRRQRDGTVRLQWDDPGLAQGVGVFETIAVLDGEAVHLHAHFDRLARGARRLSLPMPDLQELGFQVLIALSTWDGLVGVLRVQLTAGGRSIVALSGPRPRRSRATAAALPWSPPPFPPADIKHTSRAGWRLACDAHGVDEILRLNPDGSVSEGTWSNVFSVRKGSIHTAPLDGQVLPGITRGLVLEGCRALDIPVVEAAPPIAGAEGWFVSSSLQGVVPIVELDGHPLEVPPVVARLRRWVDQRVGRADEEAP